MLTFERGIGDAIITYENEILVGRAEGKRYDYVTPSSTILIENPVALIDANVERHGCRETAQAFVDPVVGTGGDWQTETSGVINWFFAGHANKPSLEGSWLTVAEPGVESRGQTRIRLQWDISF
jgi:hypothetical protein